MRYPLTIYASWFAALLCGACLGTPDEPAGESAPEACSPFCEAFAVNLPCPTGFARLRKPLEFSGPPPDGIDASDLGRPLTANFEFIEGAQGGGIFVGAASKTETVNTLTSNLWNAEDTLSAQANLNLWIAQVGSGSIMTERHASLTMARTHQIHSLNVEASLQREAPPGATFYLAEVATGASYTMIFHGDTSRFHSGVTARIPLLQGIGISASTYADSHGLQVSHVGRGMTPKTSNAIFAFDPEVMMNHYDISEEASVPIGVRYRSIPNVCVPVSKRLLWLDPIEVNVHFDRLRVYNGGGQSWRLTPRCRIGTREQVLVSPMPEPWASGHPVESGSIVDGTRGPNGYTGHTPYDVGWVETFTMLPGSELVCSLEGTTSAKSEPLPAANFKVRVGEAGENTPISDKMGHFNTNVDYWLDYRVTFGPLESLH